MTTSFLERLLTSEEPIYRYKALMILYGAGSAETLSAQEHIPGSDFVRKLLATRKANGRLPYHPYTKWQGAHWILALLADLGYPSGDYSLQPLCEQVLEWLLSDLQTKRILTLDGRTRRCASIEGNALYALLRLGFRDERCEVLAKRLAAWQWPDGGWNCDKKPEATHSSFNESLIPLRALSLHGRITADPISIQVAQNAAEVFLRRRLFRRLSDGSVIKQSFIRLHYPAYWHYDFLSALKVMSEAGFINDERCSDALELLVSRRLRDGGFPADEKFYRTSNPSGSGYSPVDWGDASKRHSHPLVTLDALYVLKIAGRI